MAKYHNYTRVKGMQSEIDDNLRHETKELLKEHAWEVVKEESKDINDEYKFEVIEEQTYEDGTPYVKFSYTLTLDED